METFLINIKRKLRTLFILNDLKKKKTESNFKTEGDPIKNQFSSEGENQDGAENS